MLLAPTQLLIFLADEKSEVLTLVHEKGASADLKSGMQIRFGEGRVGWVAEHRVTMTVDDFIQEMRHSGTNLEVAGHLGLKTELCAPMVYEGRTIGVIAYRRR